MTWYPLWRLHLFICVRLHVAARGGECLGEGVVVTLIETLTPCLGNHGQQIHLKHRVAQAMHS